MGEELLPYFRLAFRELDSFALPALGTFTLRREPARFSADGTTLEPPREYYAFSPEPDPALVREFERLLAGRYALEPVKAAELAEKTGRAVAELLHAGKTLTLPAVGTLKKIDGAIRLDAGGVDSVLDDLKLSHVGPIPPLPLSPPPSGPPPPPGPSGGPGIAESILADSHIFGPPQPKSNAMVYVYGILLILGAMGLMAAVFYYGKNRTAEPDETVADEPVVVAVRDTPQVVGREDDTLNLGTNAKVPPPSVPPPTPQSTSPTPTVSPAPMPAPAPMPTPVPSPPEADEAGPFHIIVANAGDWNEATARELLWQKKGFRVELLPGKETGTYRISVASAPSRQAAEKKLSMLKSQGRVPPDAWIFKAY